MGNPSNEIGFEIERSTTGPAGTFTQIGTTVANATTFADTSAPLPYTNYRYRARAWNVAGSSVSAAVAPTKTALIITGFSPNHPSPYPASGFSPITWTVTASGGTAVQLQFTGLKSGGETAPLRGCDWSTSATCVWTPATTDVGAWTITVNARSGATGAAQATQSVAYTLTTYTPPAVISLTATSGGTPVAFPVTVGTTITWTAIATGGVPTLQYRFWLYSAAAGWAIVQAHGPSNTYTFSPPAGAYVFYLEVRSGGSLAAYQAYVQTSAFVIQ